MIGQISARTSFEPASSQLRTSSEPASVMEFGFYRDIVRLVLHGDGCEYQRSCSTSSPVSTEMGDRSRVYRLE